MAAASNSKSNKSSKSSKSNKSKNSKNSKGKRKTKSKTKSPKTPVPKLQYMALPEDFSKITPADLDQLVLFWTPIFKRQELVSLKEKINAMITEDQKIKLVNKNVPEVWSVCKIVKKFFPSYFIPMKNNSYIGKMGYGRHQEVDFSNYQILCCTTMLLYGIITYRLLMHDQDYRLIFKGGKAIQMGVNAEYDSEDIDILVDPIYGYDPVMINNVSGHLALLIKWLLPNVSVLPPGANPHVYKLSYVNSYGALRPFSDVDFKEVEVMDPFFKEMYTTHEYISGLEEHATFRRPTIEKILEEKIFYYKKYKRILEKIGDGVEAEGVSKRSCKFFMDKFKRAITAIAPHTDFDQL